MRLFQQYISIKMETKEKIKLTAGIFILLVLTGGITYFVAEGDTAYYCEDTNLVGLCFKLSKVNAAGIQTRCYYNESAPTRYKNCKTGWTLYEGLNVTGEPINDSFNYFEAKFDRETINKLNVQGISNVEISPCIQNGPSCISKLKVADKTITLMIHFVYANSTEEIEKKLIEEAKKELAKLVAEELEVIKITNPIKIELKEI